MARPDLYLGRDDRPPGLERVASGKVRDVYALDAEHLLFVTTDRVSAFDVVMDGGVPYKGAVLTRIAVHWFERTRDLAPNHLAGTSLEGVPALEGLDDAWRERLEGRIMVVRRCRPDPLEWVVRGYLAGSGWKEYRATGAISGIALPAGLRQAEELPEPILTPTTKAEAHDLPLTHDEARRLVGAERFEHGKALCLALYARGRDELAAHGIRLADTKFELGTLERGDGRARLIDEVMTPDSSRFWDDATYRIGISPPSFDKQILRDHLETLDWNKEYPPPFVAPEVFELVSERYLEVCEKITGARPDRPVGAARDARP